MSTNEADLGVEALASHLATAFIYLDALDRRTFAGMQPALTPAQYHALLALAQAPGQSLGELAGRLLCDKANASGLIDRLSAMGLTTRERDRLDARRVVLHLTTSGAIALEQATVLRQEALERALGPLTHLDADMRVLVSALQDAVEGSPIPSAEGTSNDD